VRKFPWIFVKPPTVGKIAGLLLAVFRGSTVIIIEMPRRYAQGVRHLPFKPVSIVAQAGAAAQAKTGARQEKMAENRHFLFLKKETEQGTVLIVAAQIQLSVGIFFQQIRHLFVHSGVVVHLLFQGLVLGAHVSEKCCRVAQELGSQLCVGCHIAKPLF
jgi:hypothetical protein